MRGPLRTVEAMRAFSMLPSLQPAAALAGVPSPRWQMPSAIADWSSVCRETVFVLNWWGRPERIFLPASGSGRLYCKSRLGAVGMQQLNSERVPF